MQEDTHCQIRRTGILLLRDDGMAELAVEGKRIRIPVDRVSPIARIGDSLCWKGRLWVNEDQAGER